MNSGSLAFSNDGRYLVVTEIATNSIDVFRVLPDGRLSSITVNPGVGKGTFSAVFAPSGAVLVSETGGPGPNSSTISSYRIQTNNTLLPISPTVPTLGRRELLERRYAERSLRLHIERRHIVNLGVRDWHERVAYTVARHSGGLESLGVDQP